MNKENNLSIKDIHTIRHENYEVTKKLSFSELILPSQKAQTFKQGLLKYSLQQEVPCLKIN